MELLVARSKGRCQEIHARLLQIPIESSSASEEIRKIISIKNTTGTMARNQHQYHRTST